MKTTFGSLAAILLLCIASTANAAVVTEDFNSLVEGNNSSNSAILTVNGVGSSSGTSATFAAHSFAQVTPPLQITNLLTVTFTDVATNEVEVTVNSALALNQSVFGLKFEVSPSGLTFSSGSSGTFGSSVTVSGVTANDITSAGQDDAGLFTGFQLSPYTPTSNPISFYVKGTGLDAADFGATTSVATSPNVGQIAELAVTTTLSGTNNYAEYVGATLQVGAPPPPTPEPASLVVWSVLGICGLGIGWWRRKRNAA